ncbi:hypothetical protein [Bradyrhizobium sp. 2S1]|uniref:hypothetical protein n=1 Tax=Bradyrhizobium sp. 2S1 TaxID=1404429 RepID=UPI001408531D|nr:hypothetical protein [Bradyrhizobium sp. 2S1]MCK7671489.1 hypothetical protein [Bradyrhizobium sp. 2S1]
MVGTHSVNFDSATRQKVVPHTSQGLWEIAYNDFVYAETMLQATRTNPDATPADIARGLGNVQEGRAGRGAEIDVDGASYAERLG